MKQTGKKHTFNLAESFAREKSGGKKVTYTNPIAVAKNGGCLFLCGWGRRVLLRISSLQRYASSWEIYPIRFM